MTAVIIVIVLLALILAALKRGGAPFVAWFSESPSEFRFVEGDPSHFRSSGKGSRSFCPHCGTQLTFQSR